jgi:hypothetical protein
MNDVPWWLSAIISWLPFLVLIGTCVWMIAALRAAFRTRDGRSLAQVIDDHTREVRRANDLMRDAIAAQRPQAKS